MCEIAQREKCIGRAGSPAARRWSWIYRSEKIYRSIRPSCRTGFCRAHVDCLAPAGAIMFYLVFHSPPFARHTMHRSFEGVSYRTKRGSCHRKYFFYPGTTDDGNLKSRSSDLFFSQDHWRKALEHSHCFMDPFFKPYPSSIYRIWFIMARTIINSFLILTGYRSDLLQIKDR